ncbi:MAG: 2-amino-4-hydroxy-6-hydroxymethyldihydropteridine diphosphokinase [Chloroflexi bacterium]|nr:2-amino-4-hydroxy-6-hydroxymethyldihydropteridine diphosphokinase [Chloroflexota bacterium]
MNRAYLSLGSNSNAAENLRRAVALLHDRCDAIFGVIVSPVYESAASGSGAAYLNAAAILETELSAQGLKEMVLNDIEKRLGRTRGTAEVTIDLDIVLFNDAQIQVGKRAIPDPALYEQAYVALPLAEIAPDYVHPQTHETLRAIAARFSAQAGIARRADLRLE